MTIKSFVNLVKAMRDMQKSYFKTRSVDVLQESKRLEREVDRAIASNEIGQANLFESEVG